MAPGVKLLRAPESGEAADRDELIHVSAGPAAKILFDR